MHNKLDIARSHLIDLSTRLNTMGYKKASHEVLGISSKIAAEDADNDERIRALSKVLEETKKEYKQKANKMTLKQTKEHEARVVGMQDELEELKDLKQKGS